MTLKAPRSKPQMLTKPLSSVSAIACPVEVSPHITNLELAPVFCWENTDGNRFNLKSGLTVIFVYACTDLLRAGLNGRWNQNSASFHLSSSLLYMCPDNCTSILTWHSAGFWLAKLLLPRRLCSHCKCLCLIHIFLSRSDIFNVAVHTVTQYDSSVNCSWP